MITRRPTCNGNVNTVGKLLSSDSIVRWHFRSFDKKRRRMRGWEADPEGPKVIRVTSRRQLDALLREVRGQRTQASCAPGSGAR